ncbi:MAG: hypothetical protein ACHQFW_05570, partial [Chitinophagales bacterium]
MKHISSLLLSFIIIYSSQAQVAFDWAVGFGDEEDFDVCRAIAVDDEGNVYFAADFYGDVDFDPGPGVYELTSVGANDLAIGKLDSNSNLLWVVRIGNFYNNWAYGMDIDEAGSVYITGIFSFTVDFDPGPAVYNLTAAPSMQYILKLDTDGNFLWANSTIATPNKMDVSASGRIAITGEFYGGVDFDPGPGTYTLGTGGYGAFVQVLDIDGNFLNAAVGQGDGGTMGKGITFDSDDNVIITGRFGTETDFDPGAGEFILTSTSNYDMFVWKLDANGNFLWADQFDDGIVNGAY